MAATAITPGFLSTVGDMRWLRGHVSTFFVGVALLTVVNLMTGTDRLWSVTATGIWLILLAVHGIVVLIARLAAELVAEAEQEEIVLLPVKDAVIVTTPPDIGATWVDANDPAQPDTASASEAVSWQIATDAAQRRHSDEEPTA